MNLNELKTFVHKDLHLVYSSSNLYAISTDNITKELLWAENRKVFSELQIADFSFENVTVYSVNKHFTLLPTALLEEERAIDYLRFTTNLSDSDIVLVDKEYLNKIALIWALKKDKKETVVTTQKQAVFLNLISSIIRLSNSFIDKNKIVTFFVEDLLIVLVSKNGIFQFVNLFEIGSVEDALYYHLLTLQSLGLDESKVSVYTGGFYNEMEMFLEKMESYFSKVNRFSKKEAKDNNQGFLDLISIIN